MSSIVLVLFLTLSLLTLASRTQASPIIEPGPYAKLMFDHADSNNDDVLQRAEALAVFNRYDRNGNGRVSRAEYVEHQESAVPGSAALAHFLFYIYDVDHDDILQFHDQEHFYRLMDLNGSGYVSKAEFIYFWTVVLQLVKHLIPEKSTHGSPIIEPGPFAKLMFDHADSNNDDVLQRAEALAVFNRYDSNGDGSVSRAEYVNHQESAAPGSAALAHYLFNIYDQNNDRILDIHDYENFYHLMDLNDDGLVSRAEFIDFWTVLLESVEHLIPRKSK